MADQDTSAPTQILPSYACDGPVSGPGAGQLIQDLLAVWANLPG